MNVIRLLPALFLAALPTVDAALIYSNDFSGTGSNVDFANETVPSVSASWSVGGGSYNFVPGTTIGPGTASQLISNSAVENTGFTIETKFTLTGDDTKFNNGPSTLGFGVFGNTSDFLATGQYYLVDFNFVDSNAGSTEGLLRIFKSNGSGSFTTVGTTGSADVNAGSNTLAIALDTAYTLRLTGSYNLSGHLTLTLSLMDAAGGTVLGTSATGTDTTPYKGDYFGYRNRIGTSGSGPVVQFDNYSIATVPEPAAAFLVLGALAAGMLKRRGFLASR
jgi:hypothetical protein